MNFLKKLSNLIFGTMFHVDVENHRPSKKKLIANMYRNYGPDL